MDDNSIASLRAALAHSPNNHHLRLLLADALAQSGSWEEAEQEYAQVLQQAPIPEAKIGLAQVFFQKGNFSASLVIVEEVLQDLPDHQKALRLYAKALLKASEHGKAREAYQHLLSLNPHFKDDELDQAFRQRAVAQPHEEEEEIDSDLIERPKINFEDVGGMDEVKREIELKIIKPLEHQDLYKAYGKKVGGGILLYGPPGVGKTYLARATAGQVQARFISVKLEDILDMWIGNSEKNLHGIFELARAHTPCVLFIDEIDALGASRSDMKQSGGRHLINQFLQELDGIDDNNDGVLILGATNTPWHLDAAFRRPGRFDRIIFVPPPDEAGRESILRLKLKDKPTGEVDYTKVAKQTRDYSGADLDALIDVAIEAKLEASFKTGVPEPIQTKDLLKATKKHRASTQEWFTKAKNFALFANEGGLYDDILTYLNIKK